MLTDTQLNEKWEAVLNHEDLPAITNSHIRDVTAVLLENTEIATAEAARQGGAVFMSEAAPANVTGAPASSNLAHQDPVLISLIRRAAPKLIAHDIAGVQPMSGPSGLIFFMKSRYTSNAGTEALHNVADTGFSGTGVNPDGQGMATATAEGLNPAEMSFSIERIAVTAKSRLLKAEYSFELAQDMKAVHGLNAEKELSSILSTEITAEINREVFQAVTQTASAGAQSDVTTPGTFDLDTDSNGRWMAEKFKGLLFQIDRDANAIAIATRRGRGNLIICSSDIASALSMAGRLVTDATTKGGMNVDDTGNTFVGVLSGKYKVYIDPYATTNFLVVGYKGSSPLDAGIFYAPYVPMQLVRATAEATFQPKIGFRTRYGMVANPFATAAESGVIDITTPTADNKYYRKFAVDNLM